MLGGSDTSPHLAQQWLPRPHRGLDCGLTWGGRSTDKLSEADSAVLTHSVYLSLMLL